MINSFSHGRRQQSAGFVNVVAVQVMSAAPRTSDHHVIFAVIIPLLLTLVLIRYPAEDLFQTHLITTILVMSSSRAYCLAFGLWVLIIRHNLPRPQIHAYAYFWCRMAMKVFGSVSLTSLVCTGTSALHFVGGSVAAAAEIALETGEKDMSNFAADHDGYATRIVVNIGAPFSMVFGM
ncbi:PREDICTED: PRUPE_2G142700 [Prunus dulcis]|uniref:PREDICTED: PRUPE_2G142700 n=1 Tax=Prunus dulcis TaxID=3755 RepID=A0A5E4GKV9_PRUDU|nr:PREDICTED: PRUPE_2G142700 [Prunus dulcis]